MTTTTVDSPSQDSYWADADLPPAEDEILPDDQTDLINPPKNACAGCGEEIIRVPGSKGRLPKYHPECKPERGSRAPAGQRAIRVSKAEQVAAEEVEAALENARRGLLKLVVFLSLADPYDALVINVNSKDFLDNLRPVLMRFPALRKGASDATTIGSVFGLALTVITTVLPIMAHHNLIPKGKISQILLGLPMTMVKMQERMSRADNSEDLSQELLYRVAEETKRATEARMKAKTAAESVNASYTR